VPARVRLLSLVPRFYDPSAGIVRIDGHDLKSVTKASLRAQIGMVLQDTLLFSSSIRENIAYGREGATEEEIIEAAKKAQAHDFIMAQPQGYDTPVGERGASQCWPASTSRHRPRLSQGRPDPVARRADFRARSRN